MTRKLIYIIPLAVCLLACSHDTVEYVSFDGEDLFTPYSMEVVDLDNGLPANTPSLEWTAADPSDESDLPEKSDNAQAPQPRRTTSLSGTSLMKEILESTRSHKVHSIAGTYKSVDQNGASITLSGRLILPAKGDIKHVILVSHYTIGANYEAPSESFPLEGLLVPMGYALICPDYIGFGLTKELVHPYLCANLTAQNVVDMLEAVMPYLDSIGRTPKEEDIYLFGYSQGGATTMAVQRLLESDSRYYTKYHIRRNFAGAGPYDIAATYDDAVERDYLGIPCAIPMIIQGMNVGENLKLDYKEFFKPVLLEHFDEWINSKNYTVAQIGKKMGMNRLSEFMTDEARQKRTSYTSTLYRAMLHNSLVSGDGWYPEAPVYMFHSQDDDTVPFLNSQRLKDKFTYCNVEYNFGHYGTHQMGFVRFLGCVKTLLETETDFGTK